MWVSNVVLCVLLSLLGACAQTDYTGFSVYKINPRNAGQISLLKRMERREQLEIVSQILVGHPAYIMLSPAKLDDRDSQTFNELNPSIYIRNVQSGIDKERRRLQERYEGDRYAFDLNEFNTFDAVMKQMEEWQSSCPDGVTCTLNSIGKSHEGRDIKILKVSKNGATNPAIWFDSAIHAREWLSLATMQNIIDHIVSDYGSDKDVTSMVDSYDLYFVPVCNPDGYVYSHDPKGNRLWRKNRRVFKVSDRTCTGVDLNRNFDIKDWGYEGVSHNACDDIYCGPSNGSEVETQAIQTEINKILANQQMAAYVSFHCFGNMWVFPPGSTKDHAGEECNVSPNKDKLMSVTNAGVDAIEAVHEQYTWLRGNICEVLYPVTGSSGEYASEKGVTYTYTLELRGPWFVVDESAIKLSYEEVWSGMVAMVKKIEEVGQ